MRSLVRCGYLVVVTQDYMSRIRGGHNTFVIRTGVDDIQAPREPIDLLLALVPQTVELHGDKVLAGGLMVTGEDGPDFPHRSVMKAPYKDLAEGRFFNIAALGLAGALLGLDQAVPGRFRGPGLRPQASGSDCRQPPGPGKSLYLVRRPGRITSEPGPGGKKNQRA